MSNHIILFGGPCNKLWNVGIIKLWEDKGKKKGDKKDHQELTPVLLQTREKKQRIRAQDVHM